MRIPMKVWTDKETGVRYLLHPEGLRVKDEKVFMRSIAISENHTRVLDFPSKEWNDMAFYYFKEDGLASAQKISKRLYDSL